MSKAASARKSRKDLTGPAKTELPVHPLRPRPRLFTFLMILLALWVGFLVFLYLKTVRLREQLIVPAATTQALP